MRRVLVALFLLAFLPGCATNPVTGEKNFILPNLDEGWERGIGQQMYAPMRQSQGGDYKLDPALTEYVQGVGNRLAEQSARDFDYEFRVLNDSIPNAWALPGGKIVVNRGLLTELGSEAELAAVLGHEIIHADAAHGARAQSKGMLTQVGMMAAMIYGASKADTQAGQQIAVIVPQIGAQLITTKYGRDAERESDHFGMHYMAAAGYDPQGAVELQKTFVKLSEGRRSDWLSGLFASHPASRERVANNQKTAKELPQGGETGRDVYLQKTAYIRAMKPAYEAHDKARKALAEERLDEARTLASKALKLEPREALFHSLSGDIYASNKQFGRAERAYTDALNRDDGFFYHYLRRGQARYERSNFAAARTDLERSMELLPTGQAHYLLGNLDKRAGNLQSAVKHYQAAAQSGNKAAEKEMVLLELPQNPGKYIKSGALLGQNGAVGAAALNNSPVSVKAIRLKVEYIDASGQIRQLSRGIRDTLAPGEQAAVATGISGFANANDLARRVRVTVISAEIAE
ncbi:MAG: M48 family metalloprotease [Lysobacterales bacterium]|jgi:predicted Zn-dependent protease